MKRYIEHIKNEGGLQLYLLFLLAVFLPLWKKSVPVIIILLFLDYLFNKRWKKFKGFSRGELLFLFFYIFYVVSLLWTDNLKFGIQNLESKLSFLVLPIVFSGGVSLKKREWIFNGFIGGLLIASFVCWYNGLQCFFDRQDVRCFSYSGLSSFHHATYLSLYFNIGLLFIFNQIFISPVRLIKWKKNTYVILAVYFLYFIFSLSSKAGILSTLILIVLILGYFIKAKKNLTYIILFGLISILVSLSLFVISPRSYTRMSSTIDLIFKNENANSDKLSEKKIDYTHTKEGVRIPLKESNVARMDVWRAGLHTLKNHPFGVGVGDVIDELVVEYKKRGFMYLMDRRLNPHNQYLQTGIGLGIFGLLILIWIIANMIVRSIKHKDFVSFAFITFIAFNLLFESMFEMQAGIVPITFFYLLLDSKHKKYNNDPILQAQNK